MNQTPGVLALLVRGARWGLPWLGVLAISVTVAYAMTVAVAGGRSARDVPATITVAQAPAEALATGVPEESAVTSAVSYRFSGVEACDTSGGRTLYVGLNSWIPAEPKLAPCREGAP